MIGDLTRRIAMARPDAIAAYDDTEASITYSELIARSDLLIEAIGPQRSLILLEADNNIEWLIAYVAAMRGGHVVLMTPQGNAAARDNLSRTFEPALLMERATGFRPVRIADRSPVLHTDLALILSTSGSTGSAKGVRLSRSNIAANAKSISEYLELGPDERGLVSLPVHYSYGLSIVHSHLWVGATLLLTNLSVIDERYWDFAGEHCATSFAGVPHSYDLLSRVNLADLAPASLRYFTQAGGRLSEAQGLHFGKLAVQKNWRFYIMYGQTEATARMAFLPPRDTLRKAGSIGIAIPGGSFSLVDEDGAEIQSPDTTGQLIYRGPNVMMGYAIAPDDLSLASDTDVLETGDLAARDEEGFYRITGRLSRFVKIFGNRISLDDVERLLAAANCSAVATGVDDQLLLVTRDDNIDAIRQVITGQLKIPDAYFTVRQVDEYPLLASGKIDYAALKATLTPVPGSRDGASELADASADPDAVAQIFVATFGHAARDEGASFESLGGDSLNYVVVAVGLERIMGALPGDWTAQSVGALTEIARQRASDGLSGVPGTTPNNLDTLRAIACILVVIFHVVGNSSATGLRLPMSSGWHGFVDAFRDIRMPLFTAMAGFLYATMPAKRGGVASFFVRKARLLLVPLMFVTTIALISHAAAYGTRHDVVQAYTHGYLHLWYLYALMVIFVIVAPLDARISRSWRFWIAVMVAAPLLRLVVPLTSVFSIAQGIGLLCFFAWGMVLNRRPAILHSTAVLVLAITIAAASLAWRIYGIALQVPPNKLFDYPAGCAWVYLALRLFPQIHAIESVGSYTFTIYLWHPFANALARLILIAIGIISVPVLFLAGLIVGIGLPILLHRGVARFPLLNSPLIGR